jgi:hypothetical protein
MPAHVPFESNENVLEKILLPELRERRKRDRAAGRERAAEESSLGFFMFLHTEYLDLV